MHITHDHGLSRRQIDITAGSQEEPPQAAQTIAEEMKLHGLEANDKNLTLSIKSLGYSIYLILLTALTFAALAAHLLLAFCLSLVLAHYVSRYFGNDILGSFDLSIRSQNVAAKHEATGELLAAKGNRPIVITMTPHILLGSCSSITVQRYARWCVVAVFITITQILVSS